MAQTKQQLVQELNHEIHSPLAAIRNALYLAAVRSSDPATLRYLELADAEISRIAAVLKKVNQSHENKRVQILIPSSLPLRPKVYSSGAAVLDFLHFHAQSLLHFSESQLRMLVALENPLAQNRSSSQ
jgi:signal transduction histidine kinase